ncbi:MAG: hypothetical protein H6972_17185 [Gammaproteobacteria bacterium]|nr:hypothetical protein [Gammaproteobacteria bacterium]
MELKSRHSAGFPLDHLNAWATQGDRCGAFSSASRSMVQPDAVLVTADERYFGKAATLGQIVRLRDWPAWFAGH